jgi:hypothetical protein
MQYDSFESSIEFCITQYYPILHTNITQYYIESYSILLNISRILSNIQLNITQYYMQYYSILHRNSFNITYYSNNIE